MVCTHSKNRQLQKFDNRILYICEACDLVFVKQDNKDYEPQSVYQKYYEPERGSRFNIFIEYVVRFFRLIRALKIFVVYPRAKSILDIGSGRGYMLYYLRKYFKYHVAAGTQICHSAYEYAKNKLKLEIYNDDLLAIDFNNKKFDIITIFHVLEHVLEPEEYIKRINKLLNNQGKLILEVPNFNSWTRAFTGQYWLALDPDYHLTFFTPQSLSKLLKKYNFRIKTIRTFSLEYSTFTSVQSLVSLITRSHQLFFKWLQTADFKPRIAYHIFLFIILWPACFLVNLFLYFSKRGENLYIVAKKG